MAQEVLKQEEERASFLADISGVDERGWSPLLSRQSVFLCHLCTWGAPGSVASSEITGHCGESQIKIDNVSYIFFKYPLRI